MALHIAEVTGPDAAADALLAAHEASMRALSPAESCHVLSAEQLRAAGARVFLGRDETGGGVAIGAVAPLGPGAAELKSMHCAATARGRGHGRALLRHLMQIAREGGLLTLWLETGSSEAFAPARRLYRSEGFVECPSFGSYRPDPASVFMTRGL
ncbi:acetyltransferase, GNAT family [Roseibacterium elongatum DSM 19469]|uniref:Acetyltransferase, GNAT family n=1 Tax=Roseicyclus elongatus DSM 19469 TaxID=1294273 RepID=W8RYK8_9RHOB|nr:GNAT family N-acetyltransferase [Roseibacterium elongatum]AHM02907.1 acetyltransferase, GNAT family [Roseibacterium elongatum DSM 19469]